MLSASFAALGSFFARTRLFIFASTLAVGATACLPTISALNRASHDLDCSGAAMQVRYLGGSAYRVEGCGEVATYVCAAQPAEVWWGSPAFASCYREADRAAAPVAVAAPAPASVAAAPKGEPAGAAKSFSRIAAIDALDTAARMAPLCIAHGTEAPVRTRVRVTFAPDGAAQHAEVLDGAVSDEARACLTASLERVRVPSFAGEPITVRRTVMIPAVARTAGATPTAPVAW